jgi:hypothetical protein
MGKRRHINIQCTGKKKTNSKVQMEKKRTTNIYVSWLLSASLNSICSLGTVEDPFSCLDKLDIVLGSEVFLEEFVLSSCVLLNLRGFEVFNKRPRAELEAARTFGSRDRHIFATSMVNT